MPRIKITQPGWAGFTGDIGITPFADGVSVEHVARRTIAVIGASLSIVEVDEDGNEGDNPALQHVMLGSTAIPAEILKELPRASESETETSARTADVAQVVFHSKEELEAISDKEGIAGLRAIMDPLGVKAGSINKAIQTILKAELKLKAQMKANGQLVRQDAVDSETETPDEVIEGEDEETPEALAAKQAEEEAAAAVAKAAAEKEAADKEPTATKSDAGPGTEKTEA